MHRSNGTKILNLDFAFSIGLALLITRSSENSETMSEIVATKHTNNNGT